MCSETAIKAAFGALKAARYVSGCESAAEARAMLEAWCVTLAGLDDPALEAAVVAYMRSGAEWWPKPGQLLGLAKRHEVARLALVEHVDAVCSCGRPGCGWSLDEIEAELGVGMSLEEFVEVLRLGGCQLEAARAAKAAA